MNTRIFALVSVAAAAVASPVLAQGLQLAVDVADRELVVGQSTNVAVRVLRNGWPVAFDAQRIQLASPAGLAAFTALSGGRNDVTWFRMDTIRPGSCRVVATAFLRTGGFIQANVPFTVLQPVPQPTPRPRWDGGGGCGSGSDGCGSGSDGCGSGGGGCGSGGWDRGERDHGGDDHGDHDHPEPAPAPTRWVQFGDPQRIPGWASSKNYFDFMYDNPSGVIEVALQVRLVLNGSGSGAADLLRLEFTDGTTHDLVTRAGINAGQALVVDIPQWAQQKKIQRVFARMRGPRDAEVVCHVLTRAH